MIEATGRENTPSGNSLTVEMKGGKQNLEKVFQFIFLSMALCASVFSSSFQINRIQQTNGRKHLCSKYGLHNCQLFIIPSFRGF